MKRIVAALAVVLLVGSTTAYGDWYTRHAAFYAGPVVAYPVPVVVAVPRVVYSPRVVYAPAPVEYAPAPQTVMYAPQPVVAPAPVFFGPPVIVRPRLYMPGQPVRNVVRAVLP